MTSQLVQLRHIARFAYGDSLAADERAQGDVEVFGSNGPVGWHNVSNTKGPVIIIGRKGSHGKVQYSERPVFAIDTTYFVDRTTTSSNPRWLYYALCASHLDTLSQDVGVPGLNREAAYSQRVFLPPPKKQQAISDFLDAETSRIDEIVQLKLQQVERLTERRAVSFRRAVEAAGAGLPTDPTDGHDAVLPAGWRFARLGPLLRQLTNGYVGPTRDILVDEGVRYVQGLHIKSGRIDFDRRRFYVTSAWHHERPRTALRAGDVLIVQTGDIGQCAVVPDDFGEANCHALLIARPNQKLVSAAYLGCYLQSEFGQAQLLRLATGALHPHLEFGIRAAAVLLPPLDAQARICELVDDWTAKSRTYEALISRQIRLLAERKQALITAAVTGQLDLAREIAEDAS